MPRISTIVFILYYLCLIVPWDLEMYVISGTSEKTGSVRKVVAYAEESKETFATKFKKKKQQEKEAKEKLKKEKEVDGTATTEAPPEEPPKGVKPASKWNKLNYDSLDKVWESTDEPEELEEEFERNRRVLNKKRPKVNMAEPAKIRDAYDAEPFLFSGGGGMMVFVDLKLKQPNGKRWTKDAVDDLAQRYAGLLRTGSIITQIYNIDNERLLVNIDKTWYTKDILKFLARQPEVWKMTANSKEYTPEQWLEVEDDDEF